MPKILLVTHYTGGDVYPFLHIGKALVDRGYSVALFTHCIYEKQAKELGMDFVAWDTTEEYGIFLEYILNSQEIFQNYQGVEDIYEYYWTAEEFRKEYEKILPYCRNPEEIVIVARRDSSTAALLIAEKYHIPIMTVFVAPSYMNKLHTVEAIFDEILTKQLNILRAELGIACVTSWREWCNGVKHNIALWPEWFSGPTANWPPLVDCVGFPLRGAGSPDGLPKEVNDFLAKGEPPVLITTGSAIVLEERTYEDLINACNQLGYRAIIITKDKEKISPNLPSTIFWCDLLNLDKLIPKTKIIIHHGGIGTASAALCAGIPQLIMAHGMDRPFNASVLQQLGVGVFLPLLQWRLKFIVEAMKQLSGPEVHEACQKYSTIITENPGLLSMCQKVEEAVNNQDFVMKDIEG